MEKKPRGQPVTYTQDMADKICAMLAEGMTLRQVCRQDGMPPESTVRGWAMDNRGADENGENGFSAQYARAREIGYMVMADELLEIADDGTGDTKATEDGRETVNGEVVQRSRLRVDTRKWLLSKALPKVFGDKLGIDHTTNGKDMQRNTEALRNVPEDDLIAAARVLANLRKPE